MKVSILLLTLLVSFKSLAQKEIEGLPSDLEKEKVVFLEYEMLPTENPNQHKRMKKAYTERNKIFVKNNKELSEKVKDYPYGYVISRRSELKNMIDQGYKYALEGDLIESYNNGMQTYAGANSYYVSKVYLKELKTGNKYVLFSMPESELEHYGKTISKFIRKVK